LKINKSGETKVEEVMKKLMYSFSFVAVISLLMGVTSVARADWIKEAGIIASVFQSIENYYLYDVDLAQCRNEILKGLPKRVVSDEESGCLDEYSAFMPPEELAEMQHESKGYFGGIGVQIEQKDNKVIVIKIIEDGPAQHIGIKSGDVLLKFRDAGEKDFVKIKNIYDAIKKLRGEIGSKVFLIIGRDDTEIELPAITRGQIKIEEIRHQKIESGIGYIKVNGFSTNTVADEFENALTDLERQNISKVIIDLRYNPGGSLFSALEMLYYFSRNPDDILLSLKFKNTEETYTIEDPGVSFKDPVTKEIKFPGEHSDLTIVVLVNKYSASASEIFAGTMKDWGSKNGKFIILGEKTFGKGVGQSIIKLPSDAALRLTTFEFFVGNSKTKIQKIGVIPDIIVQDTINSPHDYLTVRDIQFQEALKFLKNIGE